MSFKFRSIVVGTTSQNKYVEYMPLVERNFTSFLIHASTLIGDLDVEEIGTTYAQNALMKAKAYAKATDYKYVVIADDSGIEVDALNGAPGLYSHRAYVESGLDSNHWLLRELGDNENRKARMVTALALLIPDTRRIVVVEGECKGTIAKELSGPLSFAYDAIFIPDGYTETYAQLHFSVKEKISHRGRAIQNLIDMFEPMDNVD